MYLHILKTFTVGPARNSHTRCVYHLWSLLLNDFRIQPLDPMAAWDRRLNSLFPIQPLLTFSILIKSCRLCRPVLFHFMHFLIYHRAYVTKWNMPSFMIIKHLDVIENIFFASPKVSYIFPLTHSFFKLPKKLSTHALSQQFPFLLMLHTALLSSSNFWKSPDTYWTPRSLWWISPATTPAVPVPVAVGG